MSLSSLVSDVEIEHTDTFRY